MVAGDFLTSHPTVAKMICQQKKANKTNGF